MRRIVFLFILMIPSLIFCQEPWLLGFEKPATNPILLPDSTATFLDPISGGRVAWQRADVFNPGAVVYRDTVFLLFRAEDNPAAGIGGRTSRIGLAWSTDGINFNKYPEPVLFPTRDDQARYDHPGGMEDPRIVRLEDGRFLMLYTAWNRETARLSAATSTDLKSWTKHGPVFETAYNGQYLDTWSKSGAVVTALENGELRARKINGKYYMYWGELFVNVATSEDGINWVPAVDENGNLQKSFEPRPREFDSHLVEPGPPALLTDSGILLFYNGKNLQEGEVGTAVPPGTYCGGQALFSTSDPTRLLKRLDDPFICPSLPHEITGQYQAGTTFIQGLVHYKGRWFLYYGTADSMVGVAILE